MTRVRNTHASACLGLLIAVLVMAGAAAAANNPTNGSEGAHQGRSAGPAIGERIVVLRSSRSTKTSRRHGRRHTHDHAAGAVTTSNLLEAAPAAAPSHGNGGRSGPSSTATAPKIAAPSTAPATPAPVIEAPASGPPETSAPVEPVRTSNCYSSPSVCGYPAPATTGVPAGVTLKPSGSITVTKPGTVISGLEVTGTINVVADNVTIEDTKVIQNGNCGSTTACGNYAIRTDESATNTTIRNVETATAPGLTCQQDIRDTGGTMTIERAYMHACDGNVYTQGPTVLKDSYGIAKFVISSDHIENVYMNETSLTAVHDTLFNPIDQTAVIFGNSGDGTDVTNCSNHITIQESLLAGGGYSLYPCAHSTQPGSSTLVVEGNHFARCVTKEGYEPNGGTHPCVGGADSNGFYPNSGSFGIAAYYYPGVGTWRGNVWDNNLTKACIDRSTNCE
jgi:hypothetical protein